ncbi:MAG: amidase [Solirubrobacteraceae bacterium]
MTGSDTTTIEAIGLCEQARGLASAETTSVALVERSLQRAEASQSTLNAFRIICTESARAEAALADERLARGERLPLLGVPVAIKDDVDLAGHPTSFGCAGEFSPAREDCEMVRRLRDAGAVIIGKTNTPEVGLYPFTEGQAFGATRNPWDLEHTPGGSSGGSAASVAAGIVAAAVGSDGAGSVRIPAAWCHLVGVKPQRGRISGWPEAELFNGLTCLGPLTRTVADAALMLDVLSGQHARDLHQPTPPATSYSDAVEREPGRLRIAVCLRHPYSAAPVRLDPEIRAATLRIAGVLEGLGHERVEASPRYGLMGLNLIARGESGVNQWVSSHVRQRSLLDRRTRETATLGGLLARTLLPFARRLEPRMRRRIGAVFAGADILVVPSTASPPLAIGAAEGMSSRATARLISGACPFAWPWNVLGWPGVSVPAGFTGAGLPIGVQLLGPENSEALLLSLAAQLERVERWQERSAPYAIRAGATA